MTLLSFKAARRGIRALRRILLLPTDASTAGNILHTPTSPPFLMSSVSERSRSLSNSVSHTFLPAGEKKVYRCLCCGVSGNAISLLTAFVLFSTITGVQYYAAIYANSDALKADCVSMGVDSLSFLGNLFAECLPPSSVLGKRRIELIISGISHLLLLGFTISFIVDGWADAHSNCSDGDDGVKAQVVLGFAIGGLVFDGITLLSYRVFGTTNASAHDAHDAHDDGDGESKRTLPPGDVPSDLWKTEEDPDRPGDDELTCGINTNMCGKCTPRGVRRQG